MVESRRKKIVIDFDNKPPPTGAARPRRKGRLGRLLLILALVAMGFGVVAVAGGYFWWQYYKSTPAYSLALLVDAVQQEDMTTIDQLVNTDKVATNVSSELAQKAAGRYGAALEPAARQQVEALVPALMPKVKQTLRDEVVKSVRELSQNTQRRPFIIVALALPYVVKITTENDTAKVAVPNSETELTLQRNGERWQIVGIKDSALVQRLVDRMAEDLPAITPPSLEGLLQGRPPGSRSRRRR
jgi:uncharacterized membrane protein